MPPPVPLIDEITTADPINDVTLRYTATRPQGFNGALDYRRTILNDPDGQPGDDTGWLTLPDAGVTETIERGVGRTRFIRLQVRWTANPETVAMAEYAMSPKRSSAVIGDYAVQRDGAVVEVADSTWETGPSASAAASTATQSWSEAFGVVNVLVPSSPAYDGIYLLRAKMRVVGAGGSINNRGEGIVHVYGRANAGAWQYVGTLAATAPLTGNGDSGQVQMSAAVAITAPPGATVEVRLAPAAIAYGTSGNGYTVTCYVYVNDATATNREVRWWYPSGGTTLNRRGILFGAEVDQPAFSIEPHLPGDEPTRLQVAEGEVWWSGERHGAVYADDNDIWTERRKLDAFMDGDMTFNSTSFNDSLLTFPVWAGEKILIELDASFFATTGTGGVRVRLAGSATYSVIEQHVRGSAGSSAGVQSEHFTTGAPANGYVNHSGYGWVHGRFYIEVSADGNAVIQVQTITGGDSYLLKQGSVAHMRRVA